MKVKYEYLVKHLDITYTLSFKKKLNELGNYGWKLISVNDNQLIFIRPKDE